MRYEITDERYGRMAESQNPDVHLETVEDTEKTQMGNEKIGTAGLASIQTVILPKRMYG
jgi:hypothetical protein